MALAMEGLKDAEYRRAFAEELRTGLAFQVGALRRERGLTLVELSERTGLSPSTISRLENPALEGFSLPTLQKLAAAFDVALTVRFMPFSELVAWTSELSPERMAPASFKQEWNE
jgi:transcriptional regulator with XRE-family HTH domain